MLHILCMSQQKEIYFGRKIFLYVFCKEAIAFWTAKHMGNIVGPNTTFLPVWGLAVETRPPEAPFICNECVCQGSDLF